MVQNFKNFRNRYFDNYSSIYLTYIALFEPGQEPSIFDSYVMNKMRQPVENRENQNLYQRLNDRKIIKL